MKAVVKCTPVDSIASKFMVARVVVGVITEVEDETVVNEVVTIGDDVEVVKGTVAKRMVVVDVIVDNVVVTVVEVDIVVEVVAVEILLVEVVEVVVVEVVVVEVVEVVVVEVVVVQVAEVVVVEVVVVAFGVRVILSQTSLLCTSLFTICLRMTHLLLIGQNLKPILDGHGSVGRNSSFKYSLRIDHQDSQSESNSANPLESVKS